MLMIPSIIFPQDGTAPVRLLALDRKQDQEDQNKNYSSHHIVETLTREGTPEIILSTNEEQEECCVETKDILYVGCKSETCLLSLEILS